MRFRSLFPILLMLAQLPAVTSALPPAPGVMLYYFASPESEIEEALEPVVETLRAEGYDIRKIDEDHPRHSVYLSYYNVTQTPTFLLVDAKRRRELRRHVGAASLAKLRALPLNASPWQATVRLTNKEVGRIGYGTGTVIHSTPTESLILTCAHLLTRHAPGQSGVAVELFGPKLEEGQARPTGERFQGRAIAWDFERDVALIRITPGRLLPFCEVVPKTWKPDPQVPLLSVGCGHGGDAATRTMSARAFARRDMVGRPAYEFHEYCPQSETGRSGGGLFTPEGFVAGVLDFSSSDSSLFATPASIHSLLDSVRVK